MNRITLNKQYFNLFINQEEVRVFIDQNQETINAALQGEEQYANDLGWHTVEEWGLSQLAEIQEMAKEIRNKADVFVLIGVGGSNQGARAVIKAIMPETGIQVVYAGNSLSADYLNKLIKSLENKSVYLNCIAKNFATLEPGVTFRVLRHYLENRYGKNEASKRIAVTCSMNNSNLQRLGENNGYKTVNFPLNIGGRYSALSPVGLLPMAVAGIDIEAMLTGAKDMESHIKTTPLDQNDAVYYAAARNMLLNQGFKIEILSCFEPSMAYFAKWWIQLFGESEGKENTGLFPSSCNYSEDLHSMGQYIQDGPRMLIETFLNIKKPSSSLNIGEDKTDDFGYINNKDMEDLNKAAYDATVRAHSGGGVPCFELNIPEINAYYMGQLFYFFKIACYMSGKLLNINPFNQEGVEKYKRHMLATLKK